MSSIDVLTDKDEQVKITIIVESSDGITQTITAQAVHSVSLETTYEGEVCGTGPALVDCVSVAFVPLAQEDGELYQIRTAKPGNEMDHVAITVTPGAAVCTNCGRRRTEEDSLSYDPLQGVFGTALGWYSGDDGELCPNCLLGVLNGSRR